MKRPIVLVGMALRYAVCIAGCGGGRAVKWTTSASRLPPVYQSVTFYKALISRMEDYDMGSGKSVGSLSEKLLDYSISALPQDPPSFSNWNMIPPRTMSSVQVNDPLRDLTNLQARDEQDRHTYLSSTCSTIQTVKPRRVFARMARQISSRYGSTAFIRQNRAQVQSSQPGRSATDCWACTRRAYGGFSREAKNVHLGGAGGGDGTATTFSSRTCISWGRDTAEDVEHAFTSTGTAREIPKTTDCV